MPWIDYSRVRQFLRRLPVKDKHKRIVPFREWPAQEKFIQLLEQLQEAHRLPRVIVVKSRRVGISLICTFLLFVHCMLMEHADARITAHRKETAAGLYGVAGMLHRFLRGDRKLASQVGVEARRLIQAPPPTKRILKFGHDEEDSAITIGSARDEAGGRGLGFSAMLATEAAYYEQEDSFLALTPTIPREPLFFVFIESTANGTEGVGAPFAEQYRLAVEEQSEFSAFFVGPHEDPGCVITDPHEIKRAMAWDTEEENRREEEDLVARFGLNEAQLAWRRLVLASPECRGYLKILHREYPYFWEQAFEGSVLQVFTYEELRWAEDCIKSGPRPVDVQLVASGALGNDRKIRESAGAGPFTIWERPKEGHWYYIGADAARGEETGDFAAAVVWDGITGAQVAEFQQRANVHVFPDMLDRLGRFYGRVMPTGQAMMNIEVSCSNGNTVFQILRTEYKYSNFYRWLSKDDRINRQTASRRPALCWETTQFTRNMMIGHFRDGHQDQRLKVRSKRLISQMRLAEQEFGKRWDVEFGHDDLLMAAMIGNMAMVQWPPPASLLKGGEAGNVAGGVAMPTPPSAELPRSVSVEHAGDSGAVLAEHQSRLIKPARGIVLPRPGNRIYL